MRPPALLREALRTRTAHHSTLLTPPRCAPPLIRPDFCLWGAPGTKGGETIGDIEAAVVSYCTRQGHGGRIMPAGTITAVQFTRTDAYFQITGRIDQTGLNLAADDSGGELDPHGADLMGNPLGGLVYSNALYADSNSTDPDDYEAVNNVSLSIPLSRVVVPLLIVRDFL